VVDLTDTSREESPDQLPVPAEESKPSAKERHQRLMGWMDSPNIAEDLEESELMDLGQRVKREYEIDINTRRDWVEKSKRAMEMAMQITEVKQYPWPRASNVIYPLLTTAATQFAARAYPSIINGKEVVRGVVVGDDSGVFKVNPQNPQQKQMLVPPGEKQARATKIGQHMSWQLLDEQPEWEEETDKLLHILPIVGCCFRKTYFDPSKGRNVSILVPAERLVINYWAKSLELAPRETEELLLYPLEILESERAGTFLKITYPQAGNMAGGTNPAAKSDGMDEDAPQEFLEQHRWMDLDEDGFPEPYIVTAHKETSKVVRIVARYDHDGVKVDKQGEVVKIDPIQYYTKYDFLPNPEGGIYGIGFGQLLRPLNEAINTSLNMMIDAGHLAVTGGGFIGKGLSMHVGNVRFAPGEYKTVNTTGSTVKENVVPLDFPGPSAILFQLLGFLVESGKEIASVKDILTGDISSANVPATTTLALIEQGLKQFTAIYKRIHRALKKELEKLYRLNNLYLPQSSGYRAQGEWRTISRDDYRAGNGVEPVSDPSMVSDMQQLGRAQFLMGFMNDPWFNGLAVRQRILTAGKIEKPEELLLQQPPPHPDVLKDMKEVQIREARVHAESAELYAHAILFMTQAKKVAGEADLQWYEHQLEVFKARLEANDGQGTSATPGDGGGLPAVAAPPGNQGTV
jgi:chaperonin GroES